MGIGTSNLKGKEPINSAEAECGAETSPPSTSRSLLPVPSHPFTGTIVWLVNFITEFQNTYLSKKEDAERFIYVDSKRLKECLLKLLPGLITAHREISSGASKNKRPFREWYCKVKDLVYEVEDLFEDIELEIKAESYESPPLSNELFEELLEDEDGMELELRIKYLCPFLMQFSKVSLLVIIPLS